MDRQEAIKILKQARKYLDGFFVVEDNDKDNYYLPTSDEVAEAIDTLIAPIPIIDEMVERAAREFYEYDNAFGQMDCTGKQQGGACFDWLEGDDYELEINRAKSALTAALGGGR